MAEFSWLSRRGDAGVFTVSTESEVASGGAVVSVDGELPLASCLSAARSSLEFWRALVHFCTRLVVSSLSEVGSS